MIGELPRSLELSGRQIAINPDYRIALNLFDVFSDVDYTPLEKAYICVRSIYEEDIPDELFEEAVRKAYWFLDGGDIPKSEPTKVKIIDYKHDESMMFSAINKAAGCEVRSLPYMHWWTFLGFFGEIGDGLFSVVLNIRSKKASGKKLEKWEYEFLRKHKELVILRSAEERAAIAETEEFLKTIT